MAMETCQQLKDDKAKFAFVVPEGEQGKWAREQSFLIKDQAVLVVCINKDGDGDSSIGGVRSFKKLPLGTHHQRLLGSFRHQYLAPLKISKTLPLYGK